MLARGKYQEASYFYTQMSKVSDQPAAFKYTLSAFLSAFRSVTLYLQAEFSSDLRFSSWYEDKRVEMRADPILRLLNEQRRIIVHERPARVIGKFTLYVADPAIAMVEAVQALLKAPDGSMVTYVEPPDLPAEFVKSGDQATVERQFFFDGYEAQDLFALCLQGLFTLDRIIGEWEQIVAS